MIKHLTNITGYTCVIFITGNLLTLFTGEPFDSIECFIASAFMAAGFYYVWK